MVGSAARVMDFIQTVWIIDPYVLFGFDQYKFGFIIIGKEVSRKFNDWAV